MDEIGPRVTDPAVVNSPYTTAGLVICALFVLTAAVYAISHWVREHRQRSTKPDAPHQNHESWIN